MKYEEVGNIEKNMFVIFVVFLKQSEKERKPMATNWNHLEGGWIGDDANQWN